MDHEESTLSTTSISDYHSVGSRNQSGREANSQELLRLKAENEEIRNKFVKLSNDYNKLVKVHKDTIKKLADSDKFYEKEIENLKKEIQDKNKEFSKYERHRPKKNSHVDKENSFLNGNSVIDFESCIENQSCYIGEVKSENEKLNELLNEAMTIFEPYIFGKEFGKDFYAVRKRFEIIKKELSQKSSNNAICTKANELLQETRIKMDDDHDNEISKLISTLKGKTKHLKTPLVFDYDLEEESKNIQILFNNLDIELRLLKSQKEPL